MGPHLQSSNLRILHTMSKLETHLLCSGRHLRSHREVKARWKPVCTIPLTCCREDPKRYILPHNLTAIPVLLPPNFKADTYFSFSLGDPSTRGEMEYQGVELVWDFWPEKIHHSERFMTKRSYQDLHEQQFEPNNPIDCSTYQSSRLQFLSIYTNTILFEEVGPRFSPRQMATLLRNLWAQLLGEQKHLDQLPNPKLFEAGGQIRWSKGLLTAKLPGLWVTGADKSVIHNCEGVLLDFLLHAVPAPESSSFTQQSCRNTTHLAILKPVLVFASQKRAIRSTMQQLYRELDHSSLTDMEKYIRLGVQHIRTEIQALELCIRFIYSPLQIYLQAGDLAIGLPEMVQVASAWLARLDSFVKATQPEVSELILLLSAPFSCPLKLLNPHLRNVLTLASPASNLSEFNLEKLCAERIHSLWDAFPNQFVHRKEKSKEQGVQISILLHGFRSILDGYKQTYCYNHKSPGFESIFCSRSDGGSTAEPMLSQGLFDRRGLSVARSPPDADASVLPSHSQAVVVGRYLVWVDQANIVLEQLSVRDTLGLQPIHNPKVLPIIAFQQGYHASFSEVYDWAVYNGVMVIFNKFAEYVRIDFNSMMSSTPGILMSELHRKICFRNLYKDLTPRYPDQVVNRVTVNSRFAFVFSRATVLGCYMPALIGRISLEGGLRPSLGSCCTWADDFPDTLLLGCSGQPDCDQVRPCIENNFQVKNLFNPQSCQISSLDEMPDQVLIANHTYCLRQAHGTSLGNKFKPKSPYSHRQFFVVLALIGVDRETQALSMKACSKFEVKLCNPVSGYNMDPKHIRTCNAVEYTFNWTRIQGRLLGIRTQQNLAVQIYLLQLGRFCCLAVRIPKSTSTGSTGVLQVQSLANEHTVLASRLIKHLLSSEPIYKIFRLEIKL